jgi:hypothetical protein
VTFEAGEPVCMIVPQRRGDLERFRPIVREMHDDPALLAAYRAWDESRVQFNHDLKVPGSAAAAQGWQKDYFRGMGPDGTRAPEHQTRLDLAEFDDPAGICRPDQVS